MRNFRLRSKRGSLSVSVFSQHNWVLHFRLRCVDQTNLQFLMSRDASHRLHNSLVTGSGGSIKGGGSMFPLWYISNIRNLSILSTALQFNFSLLLQKLAEPLTTQRSMCAQRRLSWMSFLITERRINALATFKQLERRKCRWPLKIWSKYLKQKLVVFTGNFS